MIKVAELVKIFKPKSVIINEIEGDNIITVYEGNPRDISPVTLIRTIIPFEFTPSVDYDTIKQILWIWLPREGRKS